MLPHRTKPKPYGTILCKLFIFQKYQDLEQAAKHLSPKEVATKNGDSKQKVFLAFKKMLLIKTVKASSCIKHLYLAKM